MALCAPFCDGAVPSRFFCTVREEAGRLDGWTRMQCGRKGTGVYSWTVGEDRLTVRGWRGRGGGRDIWACSPASAGKAGKAGKAG